MRPTGRFFTLLLLLFTAGPAQAHLLKLFAYVEGRQIHGSVYFAGGGASTGARVRISTAAGEPVAELTSDDQGGFSHPVTAPGEYLIQADSGDGHRAEWHIRRDEFGTATTRGTPVDTHSRQTEPASLPSDKRLAELVEQAVARQIGPLREQLQREADRARLSDIVGGIGFIFGIAGLLMWWRNRNRDRR